MEILPIPITCCRDYSKEPFGAAKVKKKSEKEQQIIKNCSSRH